MQITHNSSTRPLCPQILVDVGAIGLPVTALIDTGADTNTISYDLWVNLGQPQLKATTLQVVSFFGQTTNLLGMCRLPVYVCGYNCQHEFNVFPKDTTDTQIILGQPWQRTFECTLKWSKNAARISHKAQKLLIPFTNTATTSSTIKDKESAHEDSPLLDKDLPLSPAKTPEIRPTPPSLYTQTTKSHNQ